MLKIMKVGNLAPRFYLRAENGRYYVSGGKRRGSEFVFSLNRENAYEAQSADEAKAVLSVLQAHAHNNQFAETLRIDADYTGGTVEVPFADLPPAVQIAIDRARQSGDVAGNYGIVGRSPVMFAWEVNTDPTGRGPLASRAEMAFYAGILWQRDDLALNGEYGPPESEDGYTAEEARRIALAVIDEDPTAADMRLRSLREYINAGYATPRPPMPAELREAVAALGETGEGAEGWHNRVEAVCRLVEAYFGE